jgi:hypothetical protein
VVEVLRAEVHLQVADHVHHDEAHHHQAGDGHGVLLADGGAVQVEDEQLATSSA